MRPFPIRSCVALALAQGLVAGAAAAGVAPITWGAIRPVILLFVERYQAGFPLP